jgi:asparagine synthase (glutamine-hydrolysing)
VSILAGRQLRTEGRQLLAYSFWVRPREGGPALENETPYVEAVLAQEPDLVWTPVYSAPFERLLDGRMEPDRMLSSDPEDPENVICAHAAARGACMVLSGWGGDEGASFNGRGALAEACLSGRWRALASELQALRLARGWSWAHSLRAEVLGYLLPDWVFGGIRRLLGRRQSGVPARSKEFLARTLLDSLGGGFETAALQLGPDARANRLRLLSSPHVVERAEDWAATGARHGLAFGFPLLDQRLVEFVAGLPSELFLRGGWKRRVFRDAMDGVLPERIRWRIEKLSPQPDIQFNALEHRAAIERRLGLAAHHPRLAAMFDIPRLSAAAASLPPPGALREGSADRAVIAAILGVLRAMAYVEQHHSSDHGWPSKCVASNREKAVRPIGPSKIW